MSSADGRVAHGGRPTVQGASGSHLPSSILGTISRRSRGGRDMLREAWASRVVLALSSLGARLMTCSRRLRRPEGEEELHVAEYRAGRWVVEARNSLLNRFRKIIV